MNNSTQIPICYCDNCKKYVDFFMPIKCFLPDYYEYRCVHCGNIVEDKYPNKKELIKLKIEQLNEPGEGDTTTGNKNLF